MNTVKIIHMNEPGNIPTAGELRFEYQEVINFVSEKLRSFKRIDYDILLELLEKRFNCRNADNLLQALIEEKRMKLQNGHLVSNDVAPLLNDENLRILAA
jgi:hypothetical protein